MGIRKEFLVHKGKTVDAFSFVRADISSINANIEDIRNALVSMESRISVLDSQSSGLRTAIDRQQDNNSELQLKIDKIAVSVSAIASSVNSFRSNINGLVSNGQQMAKIASGNTGSIKKLFSISKAESIKNKQLASALKKSWQEIKKVKNLLDRKLKAASKRDLQLEAKIRSQRGTIAALNSRIKGKKAAKPKKSSSKIRVRGEVSQDRTVITVKTPRRAIVRAATPTKKKVIDVVRGRSPLV